jgi:hypothetical protein
MGASTKTLHTLMYLSDSGLLPQGASIVELGTQQLYCRNQKKEIASFIDFYANRSTDVPPSESIDPRIIKRIANQGFLGELLSLVGFKYLALDILDAERTRLFDLNIDEPGPDLRGRFDLVTNFGTTEHVLDQRRSLGTIHSLARPGGLIYHDLPMNGYLHHGYFCYTPLLFRDLGKSNQYETVLQRYSAGNIALAAADLLDSTAMPNIRVHDLGIEFIFKKTVDAEFRLPLETRTSLDVNQAFTGERGLYSADQGIGELSGVSAWQIQRELLRRCKRRLYRYLGK